MLYRLSYRPTSTWEEGVYRFAGMRNDWLGPDPSQSPTGEILVGMCRSSYNAIEMPQAGDPNPNDRLTEAEAQALLERLKNGEADRRAHGASTIADIAEGTEGTTSQVVDHVRQLRAEKAFAERTPKGARKIPIWLAAVVVSAAIIGGAWAIFAPGRAVEQADQPIITKSRRSHSGIVRLDGKEIPGPTFLYLRLDDGSYGREGNHGYEIGPAANNSLWSAPKVEEGFLKCADALLAAAENDPLFARNGNDPIFLNLTYSTGKERQESPIPLYPAAGMPVADFRRERREWLRKTAELAIQSVIRFVPTRADWIAEYPIQPVAPPPGFSVTIAGSKDVVLPGNPIRICPVDLKAEETQLERCIQHLIDRYGLPNVQTYDPANPPRPPVLPDVFHVVVKGPLTAVEFDVPSKSSSGAEDVKAAQHRLIYQRATEAVQQLKTLNDEAIK